jgi:hypothetical protein
VLDITPLGPKKSRILARVNSSATRESEEDHVDQGSQHLLEANGHANSQPSQCKIACCSKIDTAIRFTIVIVGAIFIIAVQCTQAAATCFCASMGTGPQASAGFDLILTER